MLSSESISKTTTISATPNIALQRTDHLVEESDVRQSSDENNGLEKRWRGRDRPGIRPQCYKHLLEVATSNIRVLHLAEIGKPVIVAGVRLGNQKAMKDNTYHS